MPWVRRTGLAAGPAVGRVAGVCAGLLAGLLALGLSACAQPRVAELYPQVREYQGREIQEVSWLNTAPFPKDSLAALTETRETSCQWLFLPVCFPGTGWGRHVRRLDLRTLGQDLTRLSLLYRRSGYFGTTVVPEVQPVSGGGGPVRVTFAVHRGDGVHLDSVVVQGTEGIADPDSLESLLPLQAGDLFDLGDFLASADTVAAALRSKGHAYEEVLRNYSVDTAQDRATVWLVAVPGPRVVVDSVEVFGLDNLARSDVLRQLPFQDGDLLQMSELQSGQRNLYNVDLVQFASVAVAPDSLQRSPDDSTTATVAVTIREAPEYVVEGMAGYGTVDCFRTRATWTDRSFISGARELSVTGSLSRIGVGRPLTGLGNSLCRAGADTLPMDYQLSVDLTQPYFLSPRNQLVTSAFLERQSEPRLFQRTARGGRLSATHRFGSRELVSVSLDAEYRVTKANAVLYCYEFQVCGPEEIQRYQDGRWRNAVTLSWVRDRGNHPVNPTSGYVLRSNLLWSLGLLGSSSNFARVNVEAARYQPLGNGWVLAGFARFGTFLNQASLGTQGFVPPEERFFAGGANSVRGFGRYDLGPGVYLVDTTKVADPTTVTVADSPAVSFYPTGGTSVSVLSLEARFPSPVLRDLLRLAVFVDAGTVGLDPLWELKGMNWRATPGFGFRVATPVGPARVDFAYNPYPAPTARVLVAQPDGTLRRIATSYPQPPPSWWNRWHLHIAVGQAF